MTPIEVGALLGIGWLALGPVTAVMAARAIRARDAQRPSTEPHALRRHDAEDVSA